MTGIAEHQWASQEEQGMIVVWMRNKTFSDGDLLQRRGQQIEFRPGGDWKAIVAAIESTQERNKTRPEEREATKATQPYRPSEKDFAPEKWKHREIRPDHE